MKWSKDLPQKSGWYWIREKHPCDGYIKTIILVEISEVLGPIRRDGAHPMSCKEWDVDWSGPIKEPKD